MTLYPNVPFVSGSAWTPDFANLALNPVFDDQTSYLGHQPKLVDTSLSDNPTMLKGRFVAVESSLAVTAGSGLAVTYNAGVAKFGTTTYSIAAGTLTLPDNSTSYVYVSQSGVVSNNTQPPVVSFPMAIVVTASGAVASVTDLRYISTRSIKPAENSVRSFGGQATVDYVATNGDSFNQGLYYYRNFTVASGVTISINSLARIYCSGNVNIAGTVNVTTITAGSPVTASILTSTGSSSGTPGQGLGATGSSYAWGAQTYGSGGGGGNGATYATTNQWLFSAAGGSGGGTLWLEAAGTISITGTVNANGTAGGIGGTSYSFVGGVLQYNANTGSYQASISGSGGGSGGLIYLASLTSVVVSGALSVAGGNGGNAFAYPTSGASSYPVAGGAGGGGGVIVISSPAINTTGATIALSGGTPGTPAGGSTTFVSTGVYTQPTSVGGWLGGGVGGGFGGACGGYATTTSGSNYVLTAVPGYTGSLYTRYVVPLS